MMTALIALFTLFASTFGVFIGLYEDSRDKIWAYVAARALLLAVSYGAAIAVFWFAPTAWWLLWRMAAMWATFYAFAKVSFILFANPRLTARGSVLGSLKKEKPIFRLPTPRPFSILPTPKGKNHAHPNQTPRPHHPACARRVRRKHRCAQSRGGAAVI